MYGTRGEAFPMLPAGDLLRLLQRHSDVFVLEKYPCALDVAKDGWFWVVKFKPEDQSQ